MGLPRIPPYTLPQAHEVPPSRAPWQPSASRAALLVHDMQNYFLSAYAPGEPPIAPAIDNMARLIAGCRTAGIPIFYSCQQGDQDPRDRGLQRHIWGRGMTKAPEQQGVVPPLEPQDGDIVITKHRYSAFQRSNLEHLLRARGRDQLIVCGVYGHMGCMLTAVEAYMRDFEAFIVADALADFSREYHDLAVRYVAERCGVALTVAQLEEALA